MSKELEALNKIAYSYGYDENIQIIEKALEDYENLKLKHRSMQDAVLEDFKKLKALEIIKEKNVDILRIKITQNVERYNERKIKGCRNITQEEYDLLKEVLL